MGKQLYPNYYKRNLLHWQPDNSVFSMTVRLYGSLPQAKVNQLKIDRTLKKAELLKKGLRSGEMKRALRKMHELYFGVYDDLLDNETSGPTWLSDPEITEIVISALRHFNNDRYKLICYNIMPNHIHFIFYKLECQLTTIMASFKKYAARQANKYLGRIDVSFWAGESYDHRITDRAEFSRKIWCFLNNPVKAKMVTHWEDYPFTYLNPEFRKFLPHASNSDLQSEQ
jgi:putative transposase